MHRVAPPESARRGFFASETGFGASVSRGAPPAQRSAPSQRPEGARFRADGSVVGIEGGFGWEGGATTTDGDGGGQRRVSVAVGVGDGSRGAKASTRS